LGRLRLMEALRKPASADGKLDAKQTQSAMSPLNIARTKPPKMPEVYSLIAEVWSNSAEPMRREDLLVVVEGVQAFPRSAPLVLQAALLAAARGFTDDARSLANHGLKITAEGAQRDQFNMLASALARDAAPAAPETPAEPTKQSLPPVFQK
ncbi:MAG TPA: hypothetical protein VM029_01015, partial [Opitutaceae bacterium]|nr:hypothetical protein [Opitutaceae bacterium]